ncbi:MAG: hypothetical protein LBT42_02175 [Tannerella sp.]|jgi:hypothetical protein|nr:hypothetical protein [Tannerella sp.]
MKTNIDTRLWLLLFLLPFVYSCKDDVNREKWVDLRYNPKDVYYLSASSPEDIVFEVSSTAEWKVYGQANWYSVTPSTGEPDVISKVTIKATNNTELDNRIDTVIIQSDYWIGKRFIIDQKGIAYLDLPDKDTVFTKDGGEKSFSVKANQTWSGVVTQGIEWLSVTGGATGSMDGLIKVAALVNKGERRAGTVTMYDRHNQPANSITIIQEGVKLDPESYSVRVSKKAQVFRLSVESNTEWQIEKPTEVGWLSIARTNYSQDAVVDIELMENSGSAVRSVELTLTSIVEGDTEPVVKTVVLKQAPTLASTRYQFNESGTTWRQWTSLVPQYVSGDAIFNVPGGKADRNRGYIDNAPFGIYTFKLKETKMKQGDQSSIYLGFLFASTGYEGYSYSINSNSMTEIAAFGRPTLNNVRADISQEHTITISIARVNGAFALEWWLDDEVFASYTDTKLNPLSTELITILLGFENADWFVGSSIPSAESGCTFDWWEYSPPVDWGD